MYDLITLGDVVIDFYFGGPDLTIKENRFFLACGAKYRADRFYDNLGGGAANVAINCSSLGLNTAIIAKIGEHSFKQVMLQKLIKKRVSSEFIIYDKEYSNLSCILLTPKGERTVIHYATPHSNLNLSALQLKNITNTKALYAGHLPGIPINDRLNIINHFIAKKLPVFMNIGLDDCEKDLSGTLKYIQHADVLIINAYEYAALVNTTKDKLNFKNDLAKKINYDKKTLIVTDGANGSYGYFQGKVYYQSASKVNTIIDTNGVGDGFTSGFIFSYIKENSLEESMDYGSKFAAKIIQKIGAN